MMSVERNLIRPLLLSIAACAICSFAVATPIADEEIGNAMRKFRIQAFQSFRSDRHEYDRRIEYAESVLETWSRFGAPSSERSALLQFLNQAAVAAQRAEPMPEFKFSKSVTEIAARQRSDASGRRRRSNADLVAPEIPLLPRQTDRDWAELRSRQPEGEVTSPSTMRLQARVPRAMPRRIAAKPAPASPVTIPEPSETIAAETNSDIPVNLTLLASRIRSSNLKLSEVESELMARGDWDVQRLEPLVEQFDEILSGRRVSRLYYEALNDSERRQLFTAISPPQPVLSLLSQRWFEARVATSDAASSGERSNDSRLERIAKTIDMWKSEYPGYRN